MHTYEVSFPLDSGYTLNMVIAAPNEAEAKSKAHDVLATACEPYGAGDAMRHGWRFDEITVRPVTIS